MPRRTDFKVPGRIPIPIDTDKISWKVVITDVDDIEQDVTDNFDSGNISRIATDGISNFSFKILNIEGAYKDKFRAGLKFDIYYNFKEKSDLSVVRFRGYLDGVFNNFDDSDGYTLLFEGRDCPKSSTNEHFADTTITLQFVARNNLDCWYGTTGTQDSNGNYPGGVLYNSGLKLQVYDTADNTWKVWDDLNSGQQDTIKAQEGYTQTHTNTYVDSSRLTMSRKLATEGDYDFYIYYDSGADTTYLRVHPEEAVTNSQETITAGQNLNSLGRFGKDTATEVNRFKQSGFTDSNIMLMRTKEDTARQVALWIKDKQEASNSLTTDALVSARATAKINELKEAPNTGNIGVNALPTLQPGERVNVNIPYVYNGLLKVKTFTVTISNIAGIDFTLNIQDKETKFEDLFKDRIDENVSVLPTNNPNGMRDAFVYDFEDETEYILTDCQIIDGVLSLSSGATEGTCITTPRLSDENPTDGELRIKVDQAWNCSYAVSVDGGENYTAVSFGTLFTLDGTDKNLVIKITLRESSTGISPGFTKVNFLFKS